MRIHGRGHHDGHHRRGMVSAVLGLGLLLLPGPSVAVITMLAEDFDDGDIDCWTIQSNGASVALDATHAYSGTYSLQVAGASGAGQGAVARSRVVPIDFTRDYTVQFAFRYDSFHWNRFAVFGHIRLLIDYPSLPVLFDPVGDNSFVGNQVSQTGFRDYLDDDRWGWVIVHCRPADREYDVFIDGAHVGQVSYQASVVPSSQFWFEENYSSSNYLNAWYDDISVFGYIDPQQCPVAIPGLPFDEDNCAAYRHPPMVPFHGQYTTNNPAISEPCCPGAPNGRCVVACLQMLFDYYGDNLPAAGGNCAGPQEEIEAAANTNDRIHCPNGNWRGTTTSDGRRAAHFSLRSTALTAARGGCPPQNCPNTPGASAYTWRSNGYASLDSIWTDLAPVDTVDEEGGLYPRDFETLIASGYPLIAFVDADNYKQFVQPDAYEGEMDTTYSPPEEIAVGHAVVLIGYDNLGGNVGNPFASPAFLLHDPAMGKFLWIGQQNFWDRAWPGKRFVFASPWEVRWLGPARWCYTANHTGSALVTYPGPPPLDGFYDVDSCRVTLALSNIGLQGGEVVQHDLDAIDDSGDWDFSSWSLKFSPWGGIPLTGTVVGTAAGTLRSAATSSSYANYVDRIGGRGDASQNLQLCLEVGDAYDVGHHGWPYPGGGWWCAGGCGVRVFEVAPSTAEVYVTIGNFGTEPFPEGGVWRLFRQDPGVAERYGGGSPIGVQSIPPLDPGDTLTVGPISCTLPPTNSFGEDHFTFFSTLLHSADPPESDWPQDENNHAVLADFQASAEPGQETGMRFWLENPEPTAMEVVLTATPDAAAQPWQILTVPEPGVPLLLEPMESLPAELLVIPTSGDTVGAIVVECFLYVPGGELVRETGGVALTLHLPGASHVSDEVMAAPHLALAPSRPNPSRGRSTIRYAIPHAGRVCLDVYDVSGRLVRRLVDGDRAAGWHSADWVGIDAQGEPVTSGVFFYRLETGRQQLTRQMILLRR